MRQLKRKNAGAALLPGTENQFGWESLHVKPALCLIELFRAHYASRVRQFGSAGKSGKPMTAMMIRICCMRDFNELSSYAAACQCSCCKRVREDILEMPFVLRGHNYSQL